jgi:hypothetical protein
MKKAATCSALWWHVAGPAAAPAAISSFLVSPCCHSRQAARLHSILQQVSSSHHRPAPDGAHPHFPAASDAAVSTAVSAGCAPIVWCCLLWSAATTDQHSMVHRLRLQLRAIEASVLVALLISPRGNVHAWSGFWGAAQHVLYAWVQALHACVHEQCMSNACACIAHASLQQLRLWRMSGTSQSSSLHTLPDVCAHAIQLLRMYAVGTTLQASL